MVCTSTGVDLSLFPSDTTSNQNLCDTRSFMVWYHIGSDSPKYLCVPPPLTMLSRRLCLLFCCIALASLAHGAPTRLEPPRTTSLPPSTARVQHTGPWVASPRGGAKVVPPAATPSWKADLLHRAKVGFYFGLWYALNIVYNSEWYLLPSTPLFLGSVYIFLLTNIGAHFFFFIISRQQKGPQCVASPNDGWFPPVGHWGRLRLVGLDVGSASPTFRRGDRVDTASCRSLARSGSVVHHDESWCWSSFLYAHCQGVGTLL